jgi:2,3-bisphosphoglycerate-dependent phosphoglycerate mutase
MMRLETNIYFVRHAQPDYSNKNEILRPLTNKGMADTKLVTAALKDKKMDIVCSSPYKRAFDTVKDLADTNGFEINIVEDFRERKVDDDWIEDFRAFSHKQ